MGVREYDPALGRFVSADPLKGNYTEPQTRNRYQYAANNPHVKFDLSGLSILDDITGIPGDIAGAATTFGSYTAGIYHDVSQGGLSALSNDYWQGYKSMPTWAQYADTGVILGGTSFLDLYSLGAFTPAQGQYMSELMSEEGSISLGGRTTCPSGLGNLAGGEATIDQVLNAGEEWLGEGYQEIGPGVFRSADGTRQFRITNNDISGLEPHAHFEYIGADGRTIIENSHVGLLGK